MSTSPTCTELGHREGQSQYRSPHWDCKQVIDVHYCSFCLSILHHLCQITHLTAHELSMRLKLRRCVPCGAAVHPNHTKLSLLSLSQTTNCSFLPRGRMDCKSLACIGLRHRFTISSHTCWRFMNMQMSKRRKTSIQTIVILLRDLVSSPHFHHRRISHARSAQLGTAEAAVEKVCSAASAPLRSNPS